MIGDMDMASDKVLAMMKAGTFAATVLQKVEESLTIDQVPADAMRGVRIDFYVSAQMSLVKLIQRAEAINRGDVNRLSAEKRAKAAGRQAAIDAAKHELACVQAKLIELKAEAARQDLQS